MKTLIIIPTYNEKQNIFSLIEKINSLKLKDDFSVLVVDDNSPDGTKAEVLRAKEIYQNVCLLSRDKKEGLAGAYIEGFNFGLKKGFDAFVQMDADFSHNPKYLLEIFEKLKTNDVVIASRNVKGGSVLGWSFLRNFISKGGSFYSSFLLNCPIKDLTGGFNAYRRSIIENINLSTIKSKGYCFQIEMKYRAYNLNAKIIEIPILFENRKNGKSKMNKAIFFEALINILKIRFNF